ncbi:MAG: hypothetical protein NE327_20605 [Lentisphaeraceae bacterium]|nr:hypothetical protein [Lentisphaeraceae bacterium]
MNTLRIIRFNGSEKYTIESAKCFTVDEDDGIKLWFEIESTKKVEGTCEDTKEFEATPSAE